MQGRRRALRAALRAAYPWVADPEVGPASVDAGLCDRCGAEPRLVAPCGPVPWRGLGRDCVRDVGRTAWCEGHADVAERARAWARALPHEADDVAWLWWVATGELRLGELVLHDVDRLPAAVRAALP